MNKYMIYNIKAAEENFAASQMKTIKAIIKNYLTKGLILNYVKNIKGNYDVPIKNQFLIVGNIMYRQSKIEIEIFQSYNKIIALKFNISYHSKVTILDKENWQYSNTTGKYRNKFLNKNKKETLQNITNGAILLMDLN